MSICPHCHNDTDTTPVQSTIVLKPAKVKNLYITSWCPYCNKAKGYSCSMILGDSADDPDAVSPPEMCSCNLHINWNAGTSLPFGNPMSIKF